MRTTGRGQIQRALSLVLLASFLAGGLAACGNDDGGSSGDKPTPTQPVDTQTPDPTAVATATVTAAPTVTRTATLPGQPTVTRTVSPTEIVTATIPPTATVTAFLTATATARATTTSTKEPTEVATSTPEPTFTSTPQGTASATVAVTSTPEPTFTSTPQGTAAATVTATAVQTSTRTRTTTPTPSVTSTRTPTPVMAPGFVIELVEPLGENVVAAGDVLVDIGLPPGASSDTLGVFLDGASVPDFLTPTSSPTGGGLGVSAGTVSGTIRNVTVGTHRIQAEVLAGPAPGVVVVTELDFAAIEPPVTETPPTTPLPGAGSCGVRPAVFSSRRVGMTCRSWRR